jgi:hypothetical protein
VDFYIERGIDGPSILCLASFFAIDNGRLPDLPFAISPTARQKGGARKKQRAQPEAVIVGSGNAVRLSARPILMVVMTPRQVVNRRLFREKDARCHA